MSDPLIISGIVLYLGGAFTALMHYAINEEESNVIRLALTCIFWPIPFVWFLSSKAIPSACRRVISDARDLLPRRPSGMLAVYRKGIEQQQAERARQVAEIKQQIDRAAYQTGDWMKD